MPALLTHDYFGKDVYKRLPAGFSSVFEDEASARDGYDLFLLGNQGPDPFFYTQMTPSFKIGKRFGSLMHREKTSETLECLRRVTLSIPQPAQSLLLAYMLGFVCHYTLDCIMHPFVFSQQFAVCDAGVKGLDRRDGSIVHAQIEADLDMMMLHRRRGVGISEYDYTDHVLMASEEGLALLDSFYQALAHEVYATDLFPAAFTQGVHDMRLTIRVLYSPRGIKRTLIGVVERSVARHSFAQAMSPRTDVGDTCDYDNQVHAEWTNPFNGATSIAGFLDLYEQARIAALLNIEALLAGKPTLDITKGLNFEGSTDPTTMGTTV